MSDECCCLSLSPGSRPASVDLATEAWRPRGRWAGTRRPGPHQTLASGLGPQHQSEAAAGPGSCLLGEFTKRGKKMLSSFRQEKYHFLAHLSRNLNKFPCSASHPTNIAPLLLFKIHFHNEQPRYNQSEKQIESPQLHKNKGSHYRSFWSHIIPLRLDLWQCVIRTLVCEEHKQNNSQLIPGP